MPPRRSARWPGPVVACSISARCNASHGNHRPPDPTAGTEVSARRRICNTSGPTTSPWDVAAAYQDLSRAHDRITGHRLSCRGHRNRASPASQLGHERWPPSSRHFTTNASPVMRPGRFTASRTPGDPTATRTGGLADDPTTLQRVTAANREGPPTGRGTCPGRPAGRALPGRQVHSPGQQRTEAGRTQPKPSGVSARWVMVTGSPPPRAGFN